MFFLETYKFWILGWFGETKHSVHSKWTHIQLKPDISRRAGICGPVTNLWMGCNGQNFQMGPPSCWSTWVGCYISHVLSHEGFISCRSPANGASNLVAARIPIETCVSPGCDGKGGNHWDLTIWGLALAEVPIMASLKKRSERLDHSVSQIQKQKNIQQLNSEYHMPKIAARSQ